MRMNDHRGAVAQCKVHHFIQGSSMKPKALDCCRNYSFEDGRRGVAGGQELRCSQQSRAFGFICRMTGTVA